jgi:ribose transport system substrate-binding protein
MRKLLAATLGLMLGGLMLSAPAAGPAAAAEKYTIALIPGLTTDAFYITMRKGAQDAANALGVDLVFQGAPDFNPVTQVPVLDAIIARKPSAILIAPTDKTQLIEPLRKAVNAGIPVITVDTFIDDGKYQDGSGPGDFPLSYVASDNVLGGRIAARALAAAIGDKGSVYVSNVKPGISTTDQREEGFKDELKNHPGIKVLETQFNDDDANKAASQFQGVLARNPDLAGVFGANLFSALGAANGVKSGGQERPDQGRRLRRADLDRRQHQGRAGRPRHRAAPGGDRLFRRHGRLCPPHRPLDPDRHRHRLHGDRQEQRRQARGRQVHLLGLAATKAADGRSPTFSLPPCGGGLEWGPHCRAWGHPPP